jgi:DHA1 family inner membrane transport protein
VLPSLLGAGLAMGAVLALVLALAHTAGGLVAGIFLVSVAGSVLVVCLQMRLMAVAGDAQMLGAALNHSALNLANALGAWLGGLVIAAGFGWTAPALVGACLSAAGLVTLTASALLERRQRAGLRAVG